MGYKLSFPAEKDIEKILTYTLEYWGNTQFVTYAQLLNESLTLIGEEPNHFNSRKRHDLFPGCRSFKFGKHLIFYRVKTNLVEVVRILHEKMDFESHFP